MRLWDLPNTEEVAVEFLQNRGVLLSNRKCPNNHEMKLHFRDGIIWKCNLETCNSTIILRIGDWLEGDKLPLVKVVRFIYCWSEELTSLYFCERHLNMSSQTAVDWNMYMREVCAFTLSHLPTGKIGGDGAIVEVDESLLTQNKNNVDKSLPQQWIFGGMCKELNEIFIVQVTDRSAKRFVDIIKDKVKPGSIIVSDCFRAYSQEELEAVGYTHLKVNNIYNFINPQTGAHNQHIKRMWGSLRWRNIKHCGTAQHHLKSYLAEFLFRQRYDKNIIFEEILKQISLFSPPDL